MENERFELLQFKVGKKFLQYILNDDIPISENSIRTYNTIQINTLQTLEQIIFQCEVLKDKRQYSNIKEYLFLLGNTFNSLRERCGGTIKYSESDDTLLNYILKKGNEYYPCFLIVNKSSYFKFKTLDCYIPHNLNEAKYISELIISNLSLKKLLNKSEDDTFKLINYKLSNNNVVNCLMTNFIEQFLVRAFLNCCNRTEYSRTHFLNQINEDYGNLINISQNKKTKMSFFIGIYGLRLKDSNEYLLADNIIIRNIDEYDNPGIENTISSTSIDNNNNLVIGCVIEYQVDFESYGRIEEVNYYFETSNFYLDKFIETFTHSIILSQNTIYPPLTITFIDQSLPLSQKFPQLKIETNGFTILDEKQLVEINEWFLLINSTDLSFIDLTLSRIKSAIYNLNPLASILDAFISWESMFSSKISTANSVTKSISKLLKQTNYNLTNTKLNELYNLRSEIVHGNFNKNFYLDDVNIENTKKQVIEIAIHIFKELLKNNELLKKTPSERVLHLLNPEIISCEHCKNKKYLFSK